MGNTDPLLGTLEDNGGPTQTHALLGGSPAIDMGDDVICAAAPVDGIDQRGVARPYGAACDIGAFEDAPECDDGLDNDGDGRTDFDPVTFADPGDESTLPAGVGDPGCKDPGWHTESPQCQDGDHNDGDGKMDYDAGFFANGFADPAGPDPQCLGTPRRAWRDKEKGGRCGLGYELALLVTVLMRLRRRRPFR